MKHLRVELLSVINVVSRRLFLRINPVIIAQNVSLIYVISAVNKNCINCQLK